MNRNILLVFLLILLIVTFFSAAIYAQDQNYSSAQPQAKNYNFNLKTEFNNSNYNSLKANKKLAVIKQKGSFNQADIWQSGTNSLNSALIVQVGNDNQASIKQFVGNNRALVQQYGFNNHAEVLQTSRYNNLTVSQFGNNDRLKIKQN